VLTGILNPLYTGIAYYIVAIHKVTKFAGGASSGWSWALAIVLLTATVRLVLFPLFVKQIRSQRKMTTLQPLIKELQAKHKGDRETLNTEMMKLYKEHGANPVAGCLPLLLQMPIFISLFRVLRGFQPRLQPGGGYKFHEFHGITAKTVEQAGRAKVFGAPIAGGFNSPAPLLKALGAEQGAVRIVTFILILLMGATTFITQKQLMAKNAPTDSAAATQQKVLLYVMPVMMAVFGVNVALGVLIYWTTTNLWSMAQQRIVIKAMDGGTTPEPVRPPVSQPLPPGFKPTRPPKQSQSPSQNGAASDGAAAASAASAAGSAGDSLPTEPAKSPATGANRNSRKKGQRRGGRR
jgi:YidC/Oxa1 family membrane protein insertase